MDPKLLMLKIITLLYRESSLTNSEGGSGVIVREVLDTIKRPESGMEGDFGKDTIMQLKQTILWMLDSTLATVFDKNDLMQRVRVAVNGDEYLVAALLDGIEYPMDELDARLFCNSIRKEFKTYLHKLNATRIIKEAYSAVTFQPDTVAWRHFVKDLTAKLEAYQNIEEGAEHTAIVESFDFDKADEVAKNIGLGKAELSIEGVMKTGIQAINRMCGRSGGLRRGECIVVPALQHNYKSGFTMTLMQGVMRYNVPYMRDPNKKPMVLRLSFENKGSEDVLWLYKHLKELETGVAVDVTQVDEKEAALYIQQALGVNGYSFKMHRIDPSDFTYHDIMDLVNKYEAEGYEIHLCVIDYLNMISKKGCTFGPAGFEVRDLFRRMRNFFSRKGITLMTPHQMSTEAKALVREGRGASLVQDVANKGYYDSCRTIDNEVDLEIYIHKVLMDGRAYLTVQRGKHRKLDITPEKDQYCVLPFHEIGNIRDDIHGRDTSMRRVGGKPLGDSGHGDDDEGSWF